MLVVELVCAFICLFVLFCLSTSQAYVEEVEEVVRGGGRKAELVVVTVEGG